MQRGDLDPPPGGGGTWLAEMRGTSEEGLEDGVFFGAREEWEYPSKQHPQGSQGRSHRGSVGRASGLPVDESTASTGPQEVAAVRVSEKVLPPPRQVAPSPAHLPPCSLGLPLPPGCLQAGRW